MSVHFINVYFVRICSEILTIRFFNVKVYTWETGVGGAVTPNYVGLAGSPNYAGLVELYFIYLDFKWCYLTTYLRPKDTPCIQNERKYPPPVLIILTILTRSSPLKML